jgi:hypothetical protein
MTVYTEAPALPMPGEKFNEHTVIASSWLVDAYGHDAELKGDDGSYRAFVLLLRENTDGRGYYLVASIEWPESSAQWGYDAAQIEFNIIPAAELYQEWSACW